MSSDDPTKNLDNHALLLQLIAMFREFDARQREFDARQREFAARLDALEKTVEARIYDTRPMWEAVQLQITDLRAEMEKGFRRSDRKAALFHEQVSDLYAYQRDMEDRLEKLEPKT